MEKLTGSGLSRLAIVRLQGLHQGVLLGIGVGPSVRNSSPLLPRQHVGGSGVDPSPAPTSRSPSSAVSGPGDCHHYRLIREMDRASEKC